MSWLIWRELAVVTRTAAWWVGVAFQALLLSAFIVIWGDGVPVWTAAFFEQFAVIHLVWLALVMPWVATRVVQDELNGLALLALVTAEKPVRLILARAIALSSALTAYVLTALPLTVIALRISALAPRALIESLLWPLALGGLVAATVTTLSSLTTASRVIRWLMASAMTLAMLSIAPRSGRGLMVLLVVTATMIGVAVMRAERRLRYVGDPLPSTAID